MASEPRRPGGKPGIVETLEEDFHVPEVPSIGRDRALERIREAATRQQLPLNALALSDQPVTRGALFNAAGSRVPFPEGHAYDRCYVALLDPSPKTRWAHPAWWLFVPVTGDEAVQLRETQLPESQSGSVRLLPVEGAVP